jgi:RHS repeat-associated protein
MIAYAREFRYDTRRARYLNRELDPVALMQFPPQFVPFSEVWSDYDGDEVYGDYTVTPGFPATIDDVGSHEPGQWESVSGVKSYLHSDLIGTLRSKSNSAGASTDRPVYTAFGEPVCSLSGTCPSGSNPRYGYAGAWGYQSHDDVPFLHVGARYYDPSTGRFLQRDPIGIRGGANAYAYVQQQPTWRIDPRGLQAGILNCQDACDVWYPGGGLVCGPTTTLDDCYTSCNSDFWPSPPAPQPPPNPFKPWPGCCPPNKTPRPPISPTPRGGACGVTGIEPFLFYPVIYWLRWRRRRLTGGHDVI